LNELHSEDKVRQRRQLAEQAINMAMANQWQQAIDVNRRLVDEFIPDVEAWNRLGKAYAQLGRIADARAAYESSLKIDGTNTIALRNIQRLSALKDEAPHAAGGAMKHAAPAFFIEETGKTVATTIFSDASKETLALITAGDLLGISRDRSVMVVTTQGNERVGVLDGRLSARLIELQEGGNEYAIATVAVNPQKREVRVLVREMRQSPQLAGRVSFPPETSSGFRAYTRGSALIRDERADDEDEDAVDDADVMLGDEEDLSADGLDFGEDTSEA